MVHRASVAGGPIPHGDRDDSPKVIPNISMETAYENWGELPKTYVPANQPQELAQTQPIVTSSILCSNMQSINSTATDQGEQEVQVNSYSSCLQPYRPGYNSYQPEAALRVMQDSDPNLLDKIWNSLPEERGNDVGASTNDNIVNSKLKAACYVTKAASWFRFSRTPLPQGRGKSFNEALKMEMHQTLMDLLVSAVFCPLQSQLN